PRAPDIMSGGVEPETPPSSGGSATGSPMARKPPRHQLTAIRHCASSARIAAASTDLGLDSGTLSLISPADIRPSFLPVFRSGSCANIGPKSYMEDEHVCIDSLIEHLGMPTPAIPAPGAFYGVSWITVTINFAPAVPRCSCPINCLTMHVLIMNQ
uniref:Uncharacterized protein n=1 Tax=Aegilops tauschii subsp. strangulata TaxID=200361 RepID=A0A452YSA8_AEGTS